MAQKYSIVTEFLLADKASKNLEAIGIKSKFLQNTLGPGLLKAEQRLTAIGSAAGKAAIGLAGMGVAALAGGVVKATGAYIEFDDTLNSAAAKMNGSGGLDASFDDLKKTALDVAAATRFTANDMAGAIDKMAMAGMKASNIISTLPGMAQLATAAGLDATSAIDMATDALGAFGMATDEFGKPLEGDALAASLQRISDVVAKGTNSANFDMGMWFESVKAGAPTFTALGGQIEEFTALAGKLANAGIKGGEAGTAIRNMMLRLSAPNSSGQAALDQLGISAYDAAGNMLPLLDILKQFENAFSDGSSMTMLKDYNKAVKKAKGDTSKVNIADFTVDMNQQRMIQSLNTIFGQRVVGDFLVLMAEGSESIGKFTDELYAAKGASEEMANTMNSSLKGRIELLKSAVDNLGINFVSNFDSEGTRNAISALTDAVGYFQANVLPRLADTITAIFPTIEKGAKKVIGELPKLFDAFGTAFTVLKPIIALLGGIGTILWWIRTPLAIAVGLWGSYQILMMALVGPIKAVAFAMQAKNLIMGIMNGIQIARNAATWGTVVAVQAENAATMGAAIGMKLYAAGAGIVTAAQWLWNTAILACPIAWIIGLIIVLVGIIVVLVGKWQSVTAAVDGFFESISNMEGVGGAILNFLVTPLKWVWSIARGLFDTLDAFIHGGFVAGIKMLGLSILQFIFTPIQSILDVISLIPGIDIGDKARRWFNETKAGILNPNEATGGADFENSEAEEMRSQIAATEPVNQRTVSETYNESTSRLNISLADGLNGKFDGTVAPNITLDTGKRAAGF